MLSSVGVDVIVKNTGGIRLFDYNPLPNKDKRIFTIIWYFLRNSYI